MRSSPLPAVLDPFSEVWCADFEYAVRDGGRPEALPRPWADDLLRRREAPFAVGPQALFVAYYASAEAGSFLSLGWPLPEHVLDLYAEFRNLTNGTKPACGNGLLGALAYFGLAEVGAQDKDSMRQLALRGGPYDADERGQLLAYCERDVVALERLLPLLARDLHLGQALLRGRYMLAAARMEWTGVPVDADLYARLRDRWPSLRADLIRRVDDAYGVCEGESFRAYRFAAYLEERSIAWPRLPSGRLALGDDVFREMAALHPELGPLRTLRSTLAQLRRPSLAIGPDGRNRCLLSAFRSVTGRNQPSSTRSIFGVTSWLRGLVRPLPGWGLAYIDWERHEFGIAGALSGDEAMLDAYRSGDPYLALARLAGAAPSGATVCSHPDERDLFKSTSVPYLDLRALWGAVLAVYGPPGGMKSTLVTRYLDGLGGPVLYVAAEEGIGPAVSERLERLRVRRTDFTLVSGGDVHDLVTQCKPRTTCRGSRSWPRCCRGRSRRRASPAPAPPGPPIPTATRCSCGT